MRPLTRLAGVATAAALALTMLPGAVPVASAAAVLEAPIVLAAQPEQLTAGPDGNMWVSLSGDVTKDLASVSPAGVVTYYDLPVVPGDITAGPDGNLWATLPTGVLRIPVAAPTTATAFAITGFTDARGIDAGPDGNLWAASGATMFRIPVAAPTTATAFPVAGMAARGVTTSSDGKIWVADFNGRAIAFNPDGTFTAVATGGSLQGIGAGPAGQVLVTNTGAIPQAAQRLSVGTAPASTALPLTDPSSSVGFGIDQAYWVGLFNTRSIARITPTGEMATFGPYAAPYMPRYVAAGPGGTIWVSLQNPGSTGAIARISGLTAPDVVPPDTTVSATASKNVRITGRGRKAGKGKLTVFCPASETSGPCTGVVRVKATQKPRTGLAKAGTFTIATGTAGKVKIRLKPAALRRLRAAGGTLKAKAVIDVADGRGNRATVTVKVKLRLR